jgi:hypothetical protein
MNACNVCSDSEQDKAILQIFKPLKMVFCPSCDGVPFKIQKKNRRASSLPAQIILAYY